MQKNVTDHARQRGIRSRLARFTKLALSLTLITGFLSGVVVLTLGVTAADAAQAISCTAPASGGSTATFHEGVPSSYTVSCQEQTGISGTSAYPTIAINTNTVPADGNPTLATGGSCTTSTSGSGTTEFYIENCAFSDTPTSTDGGSYQATFTATPGAFAGSTLTPITSGTLTVTVNAPTVACIAPASGGTAATFHEGVTSSYQVQCEEQSGISGVTAYPASIAIASGSLPADSNPTFATSTSSTPACTHTTSGSGATEFYILDCNLTASPTTADAGTYPFTFTATGDGGVGTVTSGTLTVTVNAGTVTCIAPASGGTAATFHEGVTSSYQVQCEEQSGISGVTAYPASIAIASGSLPGDSNQTFATSTSSTPACTTSTSGSGATEFYILDCNLTDTPSATDAGTYPFTFTATGAGGVGTATSGTLTVTVNAPTVTCIAPASGGTAATFHEGVTSSYQVQCEEQSGISGVTAYPSAIATASGSFPADSNPTFATSTSSTPACTTSTSGSGATEFYILDCNLTDTPSAADAGTYPFTFTATGAGGVGTATSGTLTVTVNSPTVTCIAPASGGSATTFFTGSLNSYTVECEEQSGISGVAAYPSSLAIASGSFPADGSPQFATSTSSSPACTTGTSGSGATEFYILECNLSDTPTNSDGGTYPFTFTATGAGGVGTATSGTLTVTIAPPSTACSTPASGGTSTAWVDGTAETLTLTCYSTGFSSSNPGNYPTSITVNSGSIPSDATEATSTSSSPACTQATSGSGTAEQYQLKCNITDTPVYADNGTYHATFSVTGGSSGAPNVVSGTETITVTQPAPTWPVGYWSAIQNVAFCDDIAVTNSGSLPLTSITLGTEPAGLTNMAIRNANLAAGTAQLCGTDTNAPLSSGTPVSMTAVATNSGGSATWSIPIGSQPECSWVASQGTVRMFDSNQDLEQAGSQSAFGQPITNGETAGSTTNYPTCSASVMEDQNGSLGGAWTVNTANPLPSPTDTNPSATQGDLASSNLELASGCYGTTIILSAQAYTTMGTNWRLTVPSPWVNGGTCNYGTLGSNQAGGNTDTTNATCPPSQQDVNAGYVSCSITASSGNQDNVSFNYTNMDLFFNGQPVPQAPTANLSSTTPLPGDAVSLTGGSNWWGSSDGAPNTGPYGDNQAGAFYQVNAPSVYIGTSRASAVPVTNSTVTIPPNTYVCTGAESATVGPNPCTLTAGRPTGTFTVPSNLAPGNYNVYIDETNVSPLPGNGPNDSYQTSRGTSLGTAESTTSITVEGPTVLKTSTTSSYGTAGQTLSYDYAVTNASASTLTNIGITDNLISSANISCPSTSLASGDAETCTGSYTTTQTDVDNGFVTNTATVTATTPTGATVTSAPSSATVEASDATSSLSLTKTSTTSAYGAAGDTINYNYAVTNTGTTTISSIGVSDNLVANVSCPDSSLAPNASETCTGSYTVSQADVDAGSVTNTATANGTNPQHTTITSNSSSVTVPASNATSSLSLTKTSTTSAYGAAGDTINYNYAVTNTGTTTISSIGVSDNLVATVSCPDSSLAPNASETCTGSYTVTQADVDAGSVNNTATANGMDAYSNAITSNQSSTTVPASNATSSLSLTKSTTTTTYGAAGDTINYNYAVTNTGTTTISNIGVSDNLVATVSCPHPSLAPTASETCTGSYTVTQADVVAGSVTNTATANGTDPSSDTVTSNQSSVTVLASDLVLVKTSSTQGYAGAGDTLNYSYVIKNDGATTITNVGVSDNLVANVSCPDSSLAPSASETCTGSYETTPADVTAGSVTNTATANGTDVSATVTSNTSSATVDLESLTLTKSSTTSAYGAAGDTINYNYAVTNSGPDTLTGIGVSDNLVANVSCPDSSLASNASETCTGSYTVTQADVDAGSVTNHATASATDPASATVTSNQSSTTVEASNATSSLSLTKSSTTPSYDATGQSIGYHYAVTNTGTTTISGIGVSDNLVATVSCPHPSLAPTASETCTGSYTVTQADLNAGAVTNTATATGSNPQDTTVTSNSSSVTVPSTYTSTTSMPSSATAALDGRNSDVAVVAGNATWGNPTGTVTFYECGPTPTPQACTSQANQVGAPVGVSASGTTAATAPSASFTSTAPGYWCFGAYYSGDSNYQPSSDTSTDECYFVSQDTTSSKTMPASSTITLGQTDTDSVKVTGTAAGSPSGTVSFYVCGPSAFATPCRSQSTQVGSAAGLTAGANDTATATSASIQPTQAGFYCFGAYYSGDTNYTGSSDTAASECVDVVAPLTILTGSSLPNGTEHSPYVTYLVAQGGDAPYKWALVSGSLPAGITLNATTGELSGTPTASGRFTFKIKVKDSSTPKQKASKTFSLKIQP